jgi:hypothetical protein
MQQILTKCSSRLFRETKISVQMGQLSVNGKKALGGMWEDRKGRIPPVLLRKNPAVFLPFFRRTGWLRQTQNHLVFDDAAVGHIDRAALGFNDPLDDAS